MNSQSDRPFIITAACLVVMLIMVFVGDALPLVFRTIVYGSCIVGIIGTLLVRNILPVREAARTRLVFTISMILMAVFVILIILLDKWFVPGDPLLLGMEPATAILVVGVTFLPFALIVFWLKDFQKSFVPPEKEKRLEKLKGEEEVTPNG